MVVAHAFNPNIWEVDAGRSLSSSPAWSTVSSRTTRAIQRNHVSKQTQEITWFYLYFEISMHAHPYTPQSYGRVPEALFGQLDSWAGVVIPPLQSTDLSGSYGSLSLLTGPQGPCMSSRRLLFSLLFSFHNSMQTCPLSCLTCFLRGLLLTVMGLITSILCQL